MAWNLLLFLKFTWNLSGYNKGQLLITKKLWEAGGEGKYTQTWAEHTCVLWPFRPLSQSALMAESKSHWLLNSWSDYVTRCVTVQAFAGKSAFAVQSDPWQPFRNPIAKFENGFENNINLCQTNSITDPTWRNQKGACSGSRTFSN